MTRPTRKPAARKCDCAAFGPDECVCGAWDDSVRSAGQIEAAVSAACTCGGAGPGEGCPACEVWCRLFPAKHEPTKGATRAI